SSIETESKEESWPRNSRSLVRHGTTTRRLRRRPPPPRRVMWWSTPRCPRSTTRSRRTRNLSCAAARRRAVGAFAGHVPPAGELPHPRHFLLRGLPRRARAGVAAAGLGLVGERAPDGARHHDRRPHLRRRRRHGR